MRLAADFITIFAQNLLFGQLLGLPSTAWSAKNGKGLIRLGVLTALFCTLASCILAAVRGLIPVMYQKLMFPLCNAVICALLDLILLGILHAVFPKAKTLLETQIHASACSGAVIGAVLMSTEYTHEAGIALGYGFRAGCGYLFACLMLKLAMPALNSPQMPRAFRGWKAMFLYAALLSMAASCMFPV